MKMNAYVYARPNLVAMRADRVSSEEEVEEEAMFMILLRIAKNGAGSLFPVPGRPRGSGLSALHSVRE